MGKPLELRGKKVLLTTTTAEDRSSLIAIRSTEAVRERWRSDDLEAEFDANLEDEETERLTVRTFDHQIIGLIQFAEEEDPDYRHASIDIYIDPAMHRKGYATDAIGTLVNYLFDHRQHHRLTIDPAADNESAIGCYAGVGFKPVGVMRSYERQADGSWADGLLMEMLSQDRAE